MSQLRALPREEQKILELMVAGHTVQEGLAAITHAIFRLQCTVLILLDVERARISDWVHSADAEPALIEAIRTMDLHDSDGNEVQSVFFGEKPVSCRDIVLTDRWPAAWRDLCIAHGIQSCYMAPILDSEGDVLGSLLLCFDQPREADEWERHIASFGAHAAGVLMDQEKAKRAVRAQAERLRKAEELAVVGRLSASIAHEINSPLSAIATLLYLLSHCCRRTSLFPQQLRVMSRPPRQSCVASPRSPRRR